MVRTRSSMPDYYSVLGVSPTASASEIRSAYKKRSLSCHPDIDPTASKSEKERRTKEFQEVADAYYILSDATRRKTYDNARKTSSSSSSFFSARPNNDNEEKDDSTTSSGSGSGSNGDIHPDPDETFASVFEDLLTPEVQRTIPLWTIVGGMSGAALGFILANIPGAAIGGFGGSRLGAIRDAKGKAVYQVFQDLGGEEKAAILRTVAMKVLGAVAS